MEIICNNKLIKPFAEFKELTAHNNFILAYRGIISHSVMKSLLFIAEKKIDTLNEELTIKRKIFSVMLNCLENICSENKVTTDRSESIFIISKSKDGFIVYTGNFYKKEQAERLEQAIEYINLQGKDILKEMYKEHLINQKEKETIDFIDEAILSLIDTAKKAGHHLKYFIEPTSEYNSFVSIQIQIK